MTKYYKIKELPFIKYLCYTRPHTRSLTYNIPTLLKTIKIIPILQIRRLKLQKMKQLAKDPCSGHTPGCPANEHAWQRAFSNGQPSLSNAGQPG